MQVLQTKNLNKSKTVVYYDVIKVGTRRAGFIIENLVVVEPG